MQNLETKPTTRANKWKPNEGAQTFALVQPDDIFEILYGG